MIRARLILSAIGAAHIGACFSPSDDASSDLESSSSISGLPTSTLTHGVETHSTVSTLGTQENDATASHVDSSATDASTGVLTGADSTSSHNTATDLSASDGSASSQSDVTGTPTDSEDTDTSEGECQIDETRQCNKHPAHDGVGSCVAGTQVCVANKDGQAQWSTCKGDIGPAAGDSCTAGADENCNGILNEGCVCTNNETRECGSSVGECNAGVQSCTNNAWSSCQGQVLPTARQCAATADYDCDGRPDNTIDEVCKCVVNETQACDAHPGSDGVGLCRAGIRTCVASAGGSATYWSECSGAVAPTATDDCAKGNDANCNGTLECDCLAGNRVACGQCDEGTRKCGADGKWGSCEGALGPKVRYYKDADSDSHGDPNQFADACAGAPSGYVSTSSDCCDRDGRVRPGQSAYFESPADCPLGFDYDCDGIETRKDPELVCLPCDWNKFGWAIPDVACGTVQGWYTCTEFGGSYFGEFVLGCRKDFVEERTVACH